MKNRWQFDLRSLMVVTLKIAILLALFRYGTVLPYQAALKRKRNTVQFIFADGTGTSVRQDSDGSSIGSLKPAEPGRSID